MPVLAGFADTAIDYLDDPILVFDQPARPARARREPHAGIQGALRRRPRTRRGPAQTGGAAAHLGRGARPRRRPPRAGPLSLFAHGDGLQVQGRPAVRWPQRRRVHGQHPGNGARPGQVAQRGLARGAAGRGVARAKRLQSALAAQKVQAQLPDEPPEALPAGEAVILPATLSRGFLYPAAKLAVVCETDIFGMGRQKARSRAKSGEKLAAFTDLASATTWCMKTTASASTWARCAWPRRAPTAIFCTSAIRARTNSTCPPTSSTACRNTSAPRARRRKLNRPLRRRVAAAEGARQGLHPGDRRRAFEALRPPRGHAGHAFDPDTPWQREFEDSFPYEETPDQLAAIEDIKRDMEKPRIMDRLLCGDVGYGKTEVALRAIFKCVMGGKQAALLAPTTILVQQHLRHDDEPLPRLPRQGGHALALQDRAGTEGGHPPTGGGGAGRGHRHPPPAWQGRELQGSRPSRRGRGTALRRRPQGGHQKAQAHRGRAHAHGHAHTAHAAHVHGRHPRYEPFAVPARGTLPGADLCGRILGRPRARRHIARTGARRAGLCAQQPRADHRRGSIRG